MTDEKVKFETDEEKTTKNDEEIISEPDFLVDDDTIAFEEVKIDLDLQQPEEVLETTSSKEEQVDLQQPSSDDELFLGLSSSAEEGDTIVFDKVEGESSLEDKKEMLEIKTEEKEKDMTKKKVAKQPRKIKRKKKTKLGFNWFFWISLIIISIPVVYFVSLLVEASKVSHLPILGERIKNTIVYTINGSDVDYIADAVKQLEGVENAEINLIVETLRITVDVNDGYSEEQIEELILSIYTIVDERIPIATYFTRDGDYKQYDLDIMAYNDINSEELIIINLIKNGSMDEYSIQVLSRPVNPELVDRLKEEQKPKEDGSETEGEYDPEAEGEYDPETDLEIDPETEDVY